MLFLNHNLKIMSIQEHHERFKELIVKAMDDYRITRDEYDMILHLASEDGYIDNQEKAMLEQLQELIENKTVKLVAK